MLRMSVWWLQLGKRPHAHSDFVGQHGPMVLHGLDRDIDVMVRRYAPLLCPFMCEYIIYSSRQQLNR